MRFQILTILLFFAATSFGQKGDSLQFSIYFTGCFKSDTLSLTLNGVNIFKEKVLTTELSDGVADYIFQTKIALWHGPNNKFPKVKLKKINLLEIVINNASEKFDISLKRGKHILIDKCHGHGSLVGWRALLISQFKTAPVFD
jgi:hypothetical protein